MLIGASRERERTVYRPEEVVGLTAEEVRAHGKVYERTITEKNLVRRTREEYDAWIAKIRDKKKAAQAGGDS